jgi:hypothetical protein
VRVWLAFSAVMVILAGCAAPAVGPSASPADTPAPLASVVPIASAVALATASPLASDEPSLIPTDTPAQTVSPGPTPAPTLNWAANGCTASATDPVQIGSKETITLKCPVGPTCTLKVTYPSGTNAKLPSPTHPKAGWWRWSWTIPTGAHAGTAKGTSTCTYAGDPHVGDVSFKITSPASTNWSISVTYPATYSLTQDQWLKIKIAIVGTFPIDPDHTPQKIVCSNLLSTLGVVIGDTMLFDWLPGDPPLDWWLQPAMASNSIGSATWQVECRSYYISPADWRTDSGTLEIAA